MISLKTHDILLVVWFFLSFFIIYNYAVTSMQIRSILLPIAELNGGTVPASQLPKEYYDAVNRWNKIHFFAGLPWLTLTFFVVPKGAFRNFLKRFK